MDEHAFKTCFTIYVQPNIESVKTKLSALFEDE